MLKSEIYRKAEIAVLGSELPIKEKLEILEQLMHEEKTAKWCEDIKNNEAKLKEINELCKGGADAKE